jgi:hypothetical protein
MWLLARARTQVLSLAQEEQGEAQESEGAVSGGSGRYNYPDSRVDAALSTLDGIAENIRADGWPDFADRVMKMSAAEPMTEAESRVLETVDRWVSGDDVREDAELAVLLWRIGTSDRLTKRVYELRSKNYDAKARDLVNTAIDWLIENKP